MCIAVIVRYISVVFLRYSVSGHSYCHQTWYATTICDLMPPEEESRDVKPDTPSTSAMEFASHFK